ncbi:MAG: ABC transporter substrate-binding protein [Limnochordia bacterium]|jgi:ABC-type glycerol-3-phosphate transport system substrate-binding protein
MSRWSRLVMFTLCLVFGLTSFVCARTKVTMMMYGPPEHERFYEQIKAGFERDNPDYELEYTLIAQSEYINKMIVNLVAGAAPDVFLTWAQYKGQWVEDGLIYDITDMVRNSSVYRLDKFFPPIRENVSYNDRIYGAPWGFNTSLFWANLDLLESNGIALPSQEWTYDDLRLIAKKVAKPEQRVFGSTAQTATGDASYVQQMMNWAGHSYLDETQRQVLVNSPGALGLADFWRQMAVEDRVVPTAQLPRRSGAEAFVDGDLAFWYGWSSDTNRVATLQQSGLQTIRFAPMRWPKANYGQYMFAQGHLWTIPAGHPDPERAFKLIEWLGSEACDMIWASAQRTPPTMPNRDHWDAYNRLLSPQERNMTVNFLMSVMGEGYVRNFEYWPTWPELQNILRSQFTRLLQGQIGTKEAMDTAAQLMQVYQDEYWARKQ